MMGSTRFLARLQTRRNWRALVALTLVVAVTGSTVIALILGAGRTSTALDRLGAVSNSPDAAIFAPSRHIDFAALAKAPGIRAVAQVPFTDIYLKGVPSSAYQIFIVGNPEFGRTLETGPVVAGRMFDPTNPSEVIVDERFVENTGLGVGSQLVSEPLYTPDEQRRALNGESGITATGPVLHLRIVGVQRSPMMMMDNSTRDGNLVGNAALMQKYIDNFTGGGPAPGGALVWWTAEGGSGALRNALDAQQLGDAVGISLPPRDLAKTFQGAVGLQGAMLNMVGLALALAALLLIGLLGGREVRRSLQGSRALVPVGFTREERGATALIQVACAALLGCALAVGGAYLLSTFFPIGVARELEPNPGFTLDPLTFVAGAVSAVALLLLCSLSVLFILARESSGTRRVRTRRRRASSLPVASQLAVQTSIAPRPPTRSGSRLLWFACIVAVVGVVAPVTLAEGIGQLETLPATYGHVTSAAVRPQGGVAPIDSAALLATTRADPSVTRVWEVQEGVARAGNESLIVSGFVDPGESIPAVVLDGRLPTAADEIALGPAALDQLHLRVGDDLPLTTDQASRRLRIVGKVLSNGIGDSFDNVALTTGAAFDALYPTGEAAYRYGAVQLRDGIDAKQWAADFAKRTGFDVQVVEVPAAVGNVLRIRTTPLLLAVLLAALAVASAALALGMSSRGSRAEHAVLRSLGMTRRQSWGVLPQHAAIVAATCAIVGAPAGILIGQWLWRWLSAVQHFAYAAPPGGAWLGLVLVVTVLVSVALSVLPATHLARSDVATTLRRE